MLRQAYGVNPATGRVGWFYIDRGPVRVSALRGHMVVPADAKGAGDNRGRQMGRNA